MTNTYVNCRAINCPNPAPRITHYCDKHMYLYVPKEPFFGVKENPLVRAEYASIQWREFSKGFLLENPICVICGNNAEITDHYPIRAIDMVEQYGGFIYDKTLYRPLCRLCNTKEGNTQRAKQKRNEGGLI